MVVLFNIYRCIANILDIEKYMYIDKLLECESRDSKCMHCCDYGSYVLNYCLCYSFAAVDIEKLAKGNGALWSFVLLHNSYHFYTFTDRCKS